MKRIILTCLVGVSLLLPSITVKSNSVSAKSKVISFNKSKIITCDLEGYILAANSDAKSGQIVYVEIYDAENNLVMVHQCIGYRVQVDLSGLPSGSYEAEVICQHDQKWMPFNL